jgi:uridine kinase
VKFYQGEPHFPNARTLADAAAVARRLEAESTGVTVIAIDDRSGGGKTTLAAALAAELNAALLHTDDFAWWHSYFDWPQMIIENAIKPLRAGEPVAYKPPVWVERSREGQIEAQPSMFVIVEGVGSGQQAMRPHLDHVIWVQTDADFAKQRGLIRDLAERPDPAEAERFWREWQLQEDPFQAAQQTWAQANYVFTGQPKEQ